MTTDNEKAVTWFPNCTSRTANASGFPADCLETLEEIAMEGQEIFHEHGGGDYRYIPCLNDDPVFISALEEIAKEHMQGWPTMPDSEAELALRERRANEVSAKIATGKQAP